MGLGVVHDWKVIPPLPNLQSITIFLNAPLLSISPLASLDSIYRAESSSVPPRQQDSENRRKSTSMKVLRRMIVQLEKTMCENRTFFCESRASSKEKTIQTRQKVAETYGVRGRINGGKGGRPRAQPDLPTASAHVSAFTCTDLITARPPLLYTLPAHGPENHRNVPNHRSGATGHHDSVIVSVGLPLSCPRSRCPCRSSSSSRASVSRRDVIIVRYSAFAKAGGTALPTCLRTPRSEN